jgi:pullulanase-type alpha-1,6-glucosidase
MRNPWTAIVTAPLVTGKPLPALQPGAGLRRLAAVLLALVLHASAGADTGFPGHARAHWLDAQRLAWPRPTGEPAPGRAIRFSLHASATAGLHRSGDSITGGEAFPLEVVDDGLPPELAGRFPHLRDAVVLALPELSLPQRRALLKGQLAVSVLDAGGRLAAFTGVQIPGAIDATWQDDRRLGAVIEDGRPVFRLWAPTARSVSLLHYPDSDPATPPTRHAMQEDPATGTWTFEGPPAWQGQFYRYEVTVYAPETGAIETREVTDPYALGLSADSARSQVIDLAHPSLAPAGWESLVKPAFSAPVDAVIYELHVRDFSLLDDRVPAPERGTFRAFRHPDSHGMRHLARLQDAGLTHVHLLPVFDFVTVPERRADQMHPDRELLGRFPPDAPDQQAIIAPNRDRDGFNWGYDPWHYTVPEGSYATDPDGSARIVEFREMVQALNGAGLRVVMDVVYNHTHAAGGARGSVLDQVVPGYYQRLDADGRVETSTCCANTASEHRMMEKLVIDSVLTWARAYRVDGFRFDLMGHHGRDTMTRLRAALDALTPARDGVDGRNILLYGEGWNFGEVANDARFVQARQGRLAGTGIGTFSDRLRDGARGGLYDAPPATQGFINGLAGDPSPWTRENGPGEDALLLWTDWIRTGLAGDLAAYRFETRRGVIEATGDIDYAGSPAGYTASPAENISYVAAHDNETLFDANQLKLPPDTPMADRVRVQTLATALVLLGQGVPFIHAGQEFLRSKSMDRDSYNSGDWFNAIDWTFERGNWGRGLPMADKNAIHWDQMAPLLADPALAPTAADRLQAIRDFEALLRIRHSSPLFRLRSLEAVQGALRFHNTGPDQVPGLVVMTLTDTRHGEVGGQADIGGPWETVAVLFNARPEPQSFDVPGLAGADLRPHPDQPSRMAGRFEAGRFHVPGRSVAVFVSAHD